MSLRASIFVISCGLALAVLACVTLWLSGGRALTGGAITVAVFLTLAGAYLGSTLLAGSVRRRRLRLQQAIDAMAGGEFSHRVRGLSKGELGSLARSINSLSERVESELQALRRAGEDYEALFDDLEDAVAVVNRSGRLELANRAFLQLAGRPEVLGERVGGVFRSSELVQLLTRGLTGAGDQQEIQVGDRALLATIRPHRRGALLVLRDMTQLRELEEVRRAFVANVSHELKTPLTSIVGFGEAIAHADLPSDQSPRFAERIVANASRMRRLVDDLLDLAKVEGGGWQPELEPIALSQEASDVWASLAPLPEQRGVQLHNNLAEAAEVHADREALRQILRNLFDNALRYAPEASAVAISSRPEADGRSRGRAVRIEVDDSGAGIPSVHQKRVFERFYRVDPARSRQAGGTGLGLAIVKHLVFAHGGEVGIESEVGNGTTAWFTLPACSAADLTADPLVAEKESGMLPESPWSADRE